MTQNCPASRTHYEGFKTSFNRLGKSLQTVSSLQGQNNPSATDLFGLPIGLSSRTF